MEIIKSPERKSSQAIKTDPMGLPAIALILYYLGGLLASLDVANTPIFLLQIAFFPLVLIAGLVLKSKNVILLGLIIMIVGSIGPLALLGLDWELLPITIGIVGGFILAVSDVFSILSLAEWFKS